MSDQDKGLLFIELQAVAQVILQAVAIALDPSDHSRIQQLIGVVEEVNGIIEDTAMGGGARRGHSYVLALHILKHVKSYRRLTDFNIVVSGITCLEQICEALKVASDNGFVQGCIYKKSVMLHHQNFQSTLFESA